MERYRFHDDGAVFFVTFSVVEWLPVFVSEDTCKIITDSLNFCHRSKGLHTSAYVIMPTHVHGIFFDTNFDATRLEKTLVDFRKFTGRQLADYCQRHMPACFTDALRQSAGDDRERRFWQSTRHPEQLETEAFWRVKLDYLHENPCRKGLVIRAEHWRFSSAGYWLSEGKASSEVVLSAIEW
jgi:REP element-mobilizing transposase RayT